MSMDNTHVSASSTRSCDSERTRDTEDWCSSQPDTNKAPHCIKSNIVELLSTRLSPDQLQSNYNNLELLKKSSFYIMVVWQDVLQPGNQHYMSNSTLTIDISMFQHVKKTSNQKVKIQLALLEMLYAELSRGREELEDILAQKGNVSVMLAEAAMEKKILRLHQVAEDFDAAMIPRKLHVNHSLIYSAGLESKCLSKFQIVLEAEKPVMFNREQSQAFCDSVVLYWHIAEQGQHKPEEKFVVHYKLVNPTNEIETREFGSLASSGYVIKLTNLRPDRSYEFSVKRLDSDNLVYGVWNDTIVLTTISSI